MKISIKQFFIIIGIGIFLLMALFFYFLRNIEITATQLKNIEYNRYLLSQKADELRQSSEDLTKFARLYVATGNKKYKNNYYSILAIRHGTSPRPENYDNTYWNLDSQHNNKLHPMNFAESLDEMMKKLPYTPAEFVYLHLAEKHSEHLVAVETKAFKLSEQFYLDINQNKSKFPNKLIAANALNNKNSLFRQASLLLNSADYLAEKQKIMLPIDKLLILVRQRTNQKLTITHQRIEQLSFILNSLVLTTFLLFLFLILKVKSRVFKPINYISKTISAINNAKKITTYQSDFQDEFEQMAVQFSNMYKENNDALLRLNLALKISKQIWFEINLINYEIKISDQYSKMLGYDPEHFETSFARWKNEMHPDDLPMVMRQFNRCIDEKGMIECEYRRKKADGSWLWLHSVGQVVDIYENNKPTTMIGLHMDISHRKNKEFKENMRKQVIELLFRNTDLHRILELIAKGVNEKIAHSSCGVFLFEKDNTLLSSVLWSGPSSAYSEMLEVKTINPNEGSCGLAGSTGTRHLISDICTNIRCLHCKDAAIKAGFVTCWSEPIINAKKDILGVLSIRFTYAAKQTTDNVELLKFVSQLIALVLTQIQTDQQLILAARVFKDTHEGIIIADENANIIDVNESFTDITGYSKKEVLGKTPQFFQSHRHSNDFYKQIWQTVNKLGFWQGDVWSCKKDDSLFAGLFNITKIQSSQGVINYIGLFTDITLLKAQQQSLELLAHYDPLTKLPNRSLFEDRFKQAVARQQRTQKFLAIVFLDLDNFKPVNDVYGHDVGDELLKQVAQRITDSLRAEDTVFRQGGDEFVLLLNGVDSEEHCHQLMTRIHQVLAEPFECGEHRCEISASSGITFYSQDNEHLDNLLRNADQAMYQAKKSGKNTFHFFNDFET